VRAFRFGLAAAAGLVVVVVALALIFTNDAEDSPWLTAAFAVTAGASFIVAGLVALWRRPENGTGLLLAATGYLWFIAALGESQNEWVWTVGFCLGNLAFVVFLALILAYPQGTLDRRERWLVAVPGVVAIGANTLVALTSENPSSDADLPSSAIAVTNRPGLRDAITVAATVIIVPFLVAVIAILVRRWRRASGVQRRLLRPVYASCGIALVLLVTTLLVERFSETAYTVIWVFFLASFAAVPLSFLWGVLRSRRERASAVSLLLSIGAGASLRDELAQALHDPSLAVVYRLEESGHWVDPEGHQVREPVAAGDRSVTFVERDGSVVAALLHDPALDGDLVDSVTRAAGLFLQNERLGADLRSQFNLLEAIANTAPSLLVNVGTDGRIINQNLAAIRASGYDDEEQIRGRPFWEIFIDPEEREAMRARFAAAAPDFAPGEYENAFTNARGEHRVIAWESAPVIDQDGEVVSVIAGGLDITERKQRELELERRGEALTATGQRLEAVIESSPAAILEVDLDGVVLRWNPAAERMFGYAATEVLGKGVPDVPLVPAERLEELAELFARVRSGEMYVGFETQRIRRDGTLFDVEIAAAPIRNTAGEISGHMAIFSDITQRKRHEEAIRAERDFLITMSRATPSLIAVLDGDGRVNAELGVNRAFANVIGHTDETATGRFLWELICLPADEEEFARAVQESVAGDRLVERESTWLTADGRQLSVEWTCRPLGEVSGQAIYLVCGTDVTEYRARQLSLERESEFLRTVANSIENLLVNVDRDAVIVGHSVNSAFEDRLGWSEDEMRGRPILDLFPPSERALVLEAIRSAAAGADVAERESRWVGRGARQIEVAWTATRVIGPSGEAQVVVSATDITERNRQRDEIRASRSRILQAGDDARRRLERDLHDGAQQRLVALSLSLRLAEAKLRSDADGAASILAGAREELAHALEELRELARGIHPAVLTERGLAAAVETLVTRVPLPVQTELPVDRLPAPVEAAAYFVVAEALTNVVKYAGATSAHVRVGAEDGVVTVEVADDGVGGARADAGTGLRGLADRVAALDGALRVESPPGQGTRVVAELPVRRHALTP
jgi:PAS domain S-box-containing protein